MVAADGHPQSVGGAGDVDHEQAAYQEPALQRGPGGAAQRVDLDGDRIVGAGVPRPADDADLLQGGGEVLQPDRAHLADAGTGVQDDGGHREHPHPAGEAAGEQAALDGPVGAAADEIGNALQALAHPLAAHDVDGFPAGLLLLDAEVDDLQAELALQQRHHDGAVTMAVALLVGRLVPRSRSSPASARRSYDLSDS
ncbi:hypothetical protein [Streptomyces sp. NPDC057429]|uniref:hypothetical protein n=1 Tax=Streptomyces sp. NPDC057429 TaxID=3346130 RepID=UPI0036A5BE10